MADKKRVFIIIACIILLAGNIWGVLENTRGWNSWNLNKYLNSFADFFSFSFAKLYELETMRRFIDSPGSLYFELQVLDFVLLITALITSIFLYKTKFGRIFLICFFIIAIALQVIITIRELSFFNSLARDYLPSSWNSHIESGWYLKCLLPRSVYVLLSGIAVFILFTPQKRNFDTNRS